MCQISGINEKYFVWSTFEHSGCHIIYVKLNSKEVFFWNYRFSSKISDRKIYFLDVKIFRSWFSKIFMEIFKKNEISKISIEISIEIFEISKFWKFPWKFSKIMIGNWAASRTAFWKFVDVCRAVLREVHFSKKLPQSCAGRKILRKWTNQARLTVVLFFADPKISSSKRS